MAGGLGKDAVAEGLAIIMPEKEKFKFVFEPCGTQLRRLYQPLGKFHGQRKEGK
jgi:hypothetical protein